MEVVVILVIFGANGATVLVITSERIELEGCACAQIEALEEWNGLLHQDDAWDLSERGKNVADIMKLLKWLKLPNHCFISIFLSAVAVLGQHHSKY